MTNLSNLGQTIVATLGAILLTSTAVAAAVGPARAIETNPVYAHAQVAAANV